MEGDYFWGDGDQWPKVNFYQTATPVPEIMDSSGISTLPLPQ
jgi:hypothetical protein